MKHRLIAVGTVLVTGLATPSAFAAANGPQVSVRVEGLNATLLKAVTVSAPQTGSITKAGVAAGACPANSGQGALAVATRGNWMGTYYTSLKSYDITSILGDTPNPKQDYFEIFVNDVPAAVGACEISLKPGERLLFAVVPDTGKAETPLGLSSTVSRGKVTAKVVGYDAKGHASPLKGATVTLGHRSARTTAAGTATFTAPHGSSTLTASATGYIRDEMTLGAQQRAY